MQTYNDYDKALYYTYCCNWDKLLVLMVQTNDQLFSKRIEHFLHAYQYSKELPEVDKQLRLLFQYIDHASQKSHIEEVEQIQM
ncbi:YhdB family protein [Bacillus anthracis]